MLKDKKYKYNQTLIKEYYNPVENKKKYKLITMNVLRTSGVEDDNDKGRNKGTVNTEKLEENIIRTRSRIEELAYCNSWDWFFTGTLDPNKYDRSDLEKFHKDLTQWLRDYNKKFKLHIKFLLIPELHSDGVSWHVHGLLSGLPKEHLHKFSVGDTFGKYIAEKVVSGDDVYSWSDYLYKFGFNDIEPIKSQEAVSRYITKYISKNLFCSVKKLNAHMYYCSRGLNRALTIKKGTMSANIVPVGYQNEYCSITWLDDNPLIISEILDNIEP